MKSLLPILLISTIVSGQNPLIKEGWALTFNDEFNGTELDRYKWQPHIYWGGYSDEVSYVSLDQLQFTDSTLKIVADITSKTDTLPYKTGLIDNHKHFNQQYGFFEIRSKNPFGTGFWPAFWLVSTEQWPPEIDIYEFYTNEPDRLSTTQHWLNRKKVKKMQPKNYKIEDASEEFHIYSLEWTPKKLIWYYDNNKIRTSRRGAKYMTHALHIIVNNRIGGYSEADIGNAIFPNALEIDYVRSYKRSRP